MSGLIGIETRMALAFIDFFDLNDEWRKRSWVLFGGLVKASKFLSEENDVIFKLDDVREYFDLQKVEKLVFETHGAKEKYGDKWEAAISPLRDFLLGIPHFDPAKIGEQDQRAAEFYGFCVMQIARLMNDLPNISCLDESVPCTLDNATERAFRIATTNARNAMHAVKIAIEEGDTDEALRLIDEALGGDAAQN